MLGIRLTRIGNIHYPVPPVHPSSTPFGYRRHISLKLKLSGKSFKLGFATVEGSHIPIYSCLLLEPEHSIIPFLQDVFSKVATMTFEDVKKFQDEKIKNKPASILVLGKKDLLDIKTLEKYGTVKYLTLKDIFGY